MSCCTWRAALVAAVDDGLGRSTIRLAVAVADEGTFVAAFDGVDCSPKMLPLPQVVVDGSEEII